MKFDAIDGYLLDGRPSKAQAIAAALHERVADERAVPFYRALEAIGVRAADEALIALRLVIGGQVPSDEAVRRLRGLAALARARDRTAIAAAFANGARTFEELRPLADDPAAIAAAARAAYAATF